MEDIAKYFIFAFSYLSAMKCDIFYFFRHFMATVLRNESIDVSMELYSTLVPHVFSPNIDFYRQLIQEIDIQKGHNHLPKIWIDLGASNFTGLGNSKIEQKMQIMERFAASMQYADLEIFTDFDDGENESKLILLQVYNRTHYINFKHNPLYLEI